jgi:hypothetical protein
MADDWYAKWLRSGRLPDGRTAFLVLNGDKAFVCCDPVVFERKSSGLPIPDPGETAEDGFVTPWEPFSP